MENKDTKTDDLIALDNLEIEPLSDDDLEDVVGGWCSCWCCSKIEQQE